MKRSERELKRLGLRPIRYHDLRHTNINLLLEVGASLKEAQDWAGYKSIITTADIYARTLTKAKQRMTDSMDEILYGFTP